MNTDLAFIIDNSDFLTASGQKSTSLSLGYTIFTSFNYKYKIIAIILAGIIAFLTLLEFIYCLIINIQSTKSKKALKLEN